MKMLYIYVRESSIMSAAKDGLFPWLEMRLSSNICCTELICLEEQTEHLGHTSISSQPSGFVQCQKNTSAPERSLPVETS